jgi:uncharacterized protein YuzE
MRVDYDPEADAAYVYLREPARVERTEELDTDRLIDYEGDAPVGVELLNLRLGVHLDGLPQAEQIAAALLEQLGMHRAEVLVLPQPAAARAG